MSGNTDIFIFSSWIMRGRICNARKSYGLVQIQLTPPYLSTPVGERKLEFNGPTTRGSRELLTADVSPAWDLEKYTSPIDYSKLWPPNTSCMRSIIHWDAEYMYGMQLCLHVLDGFITMRNGISAKEVLQYHLQLPLV